MKAIRKTFRVSTVLPATSCSVTSPGKSDGRLDYCAVTRFPLVVRSARNESGGYLFRAKR